MGAFALKKSVLSLFAVAALALLVRLPGLFWGFNSFTVPSFTVYHVDELHLAFIERKILGEVDAGRVQEKIPAYTGIQKLADAGLSLFRTYAIREKCPPPVVRSLGLALWVAQGIRPDVTVRKIYYPMGYPYEVAGLASLFHFKNITPLILFGRALSIFYSLLTVILIYFLSRELFSSSRLALWASAFLALAGLHVTQSHFATVDSGNTFWIYATVYFSLLSLRRQKTVYFLFALLSAAIGLTFKLEWVTLIPLFYILGRQKPPRSLRFLTVFVLAFFFLATVGCFYSFSNMFFILHNVIKNNLGVGGGHNKLLNPLVYFVQLFAGMGLPVFLLFLYGSWRLFQNRRSLENIFSKDVFVAFFLPLLLLFVSICFIKQHYCRHPLPLVPLLTMVAAYGFLEATKNRFRGFQMKTAFLFSTILIYQLVYVGSTEYYFVYDTREAAAKWVIENVRPGTALTYEGLPALPEYNLNMNYDSPYIILSLLKLPSLSKSASVPLGKINPDRKSVDTGSPEQREIIKNLFNGTYPYTLVKKFEIKSFTPELLLYKKMLGIYPMVIRDTVIFKSNETAADTASRDQKNKPRLLCLLLELY